MGMEIYHTTSIAIGQEWLVLLAEDEMTMCLHAEEWYLVFYIRGYLVAGKGFVVHNDQLY